MTKCSTFSKRMKYSLQTKVYKNTSRCQNQYWDKNSSLNFNNRTKARPEVNLFRNCGLLGLSNRDLGDFVVETKPDQVCWESFLGHSGGVGTIDSLTLTGLLSLRFTYSWLFQIFFFSALVLTSTSSDLPLGSFGLYTG